MKTFYRFRSIRSLLERRELEDQYFYFASPTQQNDPMEGHLAFYWQGDDIVWLGLFKHYTWQLCMAILMIPVAKNITALNEFYRDWSEYQWERAFPELRTRVENAVTEDAHIRALADTLGKTERKLSATDLQAILCAIHSLVLSYAVQSLEKEGLSFFRQPAVPKDGTQDIIDAFIDALSKGDVPAFMLLAQVVTALSCLRSTASQLGQSENRQNNRILAWILFDFPTMYIEHVRTLACPDWYCVCFNTAVSNPALWGYYADGHKGVCLMFKGGKYDDIWLTGLSPDVGMLDTRSFAFRQVHYDQPPSEVDFFSCLGLLLSVDHQHWFFHKGRESRKCTEIGKAPDIWSANLRRAADRYLHKSATWAQEQEYRLVLEESWIWKRKEMTRRYLYDFRDLEGIIFGMRTPQDEKLEIRRIITQKCKATGRKSFPFYQAGFDAATGQIVTERISSLSSYGGAEIGTYIKTYIDMCLN